MQPRAGQRATVWAVDTRHPLTEAPYSPLRATLTASLAGDQALARSLRPTHDRLTPGTETVREPEKEMFTIRGRLPRVEHGDTEHLKPG